MKRSTIFTLLLIAASLLACGGTVSPASSDPSVSGPLEIRATSEIALLDQAGIFKDFTSQSGVPVNLHLDRGSVEIKLNIESISKDHPSDVDVYVTASPIWMPGATIAGKTPIMVSVVTFPVDGAKARELGWDTNKGITIGDIIPAVRAKKLAVCAASASQDDAATNFYLAVLDALKGTGETLRIEDLSTASIVGPMKEFYSGVVSGGNNSDFLWHTMLTDREKGNSKCNAAVLPESAAIALNTQLVGKGLEPMTVFYVQGATSLQSYTMGYVSGISDLKQKQYQMLVAYLQRPEIQTRILALGFRASAVGIRVANPDTKVFNTSWGIRPQDEFLLTDLPKEAVIAKALSLYQSDLRRASFTVYCLDFSGSMAEGDGKRDLLIAMKALLDQTQASTYLLQASPEDSTVAILFSYQNLGEYIVQGNNPGELNGLYDIIANQRTGGNTNLFGCVHEALQIVKTHAGPNQLPAVILLTDGKHNNGPDLGNSQMNDFIRTAGIPVYSIMIAEADPSQLQPLADKTNGALCDGRGGLEALVRCFRTFKGNN